MIDFRAVAEEIAAVLVARGDMAAAGWPIPAPSPPCAVVGYPEAGDYVQVYGSPELVSAALPVVLMPGLPNEESTRDVLAGWLDGATSVPATLAGHLWVACADVVATSASEPDVISAGGADILTVTLSLEVVA